MAFGLPEYIEVLVISIALSLATVIVSMVLGNQAGLKNLKAEMKAINEKVSRARKEGNAKEINRLSSELMKLSGKQFHLNMRPMMFSFMLFIVAFWFLGAYYTSLVIASPVSIPMIGSQLGWFHWYLLIVLPGSFLFRKLLGVE